MIILVAVDDENGLLFNHRRQSQDEMVRQHMIRLSQNSCLWMNHYSATQFQKTNSVKIKIDEDFLEKASNGEYCFVENVAIRSYEKKIESVILFKWNRLYPKDYCMDINLREEWKLKYVNEFKGTSHPRITMEVYTR